LSIWFGCRFSMIWWKLAVYSDSSVAEFHIGRVIGGSSSGRGTASSLLQS
jgi:hypothetical protein